MVLSIIIYTVYTGVPPASAAAGKVVTLYSSAMSGLAIDSKVKHGVGINMRTQ